MSLRGGTSVLRTLLTQYENLDYVNIIGEYLRVYTQYPAMLSSWFDMGLIKSLLRAVLNTVFDI